MIDLKHDTAPNSPSESPDCCELCGTLIDSERQLLVPGTELCSDCAAAGWR